MAAVLTGTPVAVDWGTTAADPAGQSITIPADCTAVYMFYAFWAFGAGVDLSSATLASNSPSQTFTRASGSTDKNGNGVCVWYNPSTGSQTLDVAWTTFVSEGPVTIVAFVKDGNVTAWRDAQGDSDTSTNAVTATVSTQSGDLVLKFDKHDTTVPSLTSGWTSGQTQSGVSGSDAARLSYISASGATQVCDSEDENYSSIMAVSIPGLGGAYNAVPLLDDYYRRIRRGR